MTDADEIARRARELAERAQRIAEDSSDTAALREELDRLDAELARLDEEQRRLDGELRDHGEAKTTEIHDDEDDDAEATRPQWAETVFDLVSDVTERISALGSGGWPWRSSETLERSVAIDGPTTVVVENRAGSIKVEAGDTDVVTVSAELFAPSPHLLEEMTVTAEARGAEVLVRCDWPDHRHGRRARVIVTVPAGTAVRADTLGGSITVQQTHGPAAARTKGGSIKVVGASGEVDARTAGGSIRVDDHTGPVHAITSGGSVHLAGVLTGTVEAKTAGGSVHIDGAERATVVASTSGGSIHVRGRLAGASRIRTAGGSVTVSIPSDTQVHIDGKGSNASCDFADLDTQRGRITGTLGDGSDGTIEFRTSAGSVTLAKT
ncbi:MAG: putative adhesin [Acidimicrobiaceae bacterium]